MDAINCQTSGCLAARYADEAEARGVLGELKALCAPVGEWRGRELDDYGLPGRRPTITPLDQ